MTLTYYFIVKGIILLPLSIAYPIILSAPVLLSLLGIIILKERPLIVFILTRCVKGCFKLVKLRYQSSLDCRT